MSYIIGVDIGGTKCAVVLSKYSEARPEILGCRVCPTADRGNPAEMLDFLCLAGMSLLEELGVAKGALKSVGISCGGPLDSQRGLILNPPNLPGWDEVYVTRAFETFFSVPAFLENDANAGALAEWKWGAGTGCKNIVFLTFGTGLGAGLILDGHLYRGTNDMAGEVGHIRMAEGGPVGYGKAGSLEGFCSGGGMSTRSGRFRSAHEVFDAMAKGDAEANEIVTQCAMYLGCGLAIIADILNPERIIIGGIYPRQQAVLREKMRKVFLREALPLSASVCRIVPAELGERIGDYAALAVAMR